MTKGQLIAQIQLSLGIQFMTRLIASYIDSAFNTVVGQLFLANPNQYDFYSKQYILDVVNECPIPYALLPVPIIQTVDNAQGVRQIYNTGENDLNFVPMPKSGFQLYKKLIVGRVMKQVGYVPKIDRIEFMNLPSSVTKIRAELVRPFMAYDDNEEFPLPDGVAEVIMGMVRESMTNGKPQTNIHKPQ